MIDVHCHVIPGVDDGSRSFEMSLAMLRQAVNEGISSIIATPHCRPEREYQIDEIREKADRLKRLAAENGIPIGIHLGSELRRDSLPERLSKKECLTMAGSDYALIEFGTGDSLRTIDRALRSLVLEGYRPIVAHVERYENVRGEFDSIEDWIDQGILIQCNASAITGEEGFRLSQFTHKLLKYDMVHLIGTDSHSDTWRHPEAARCLKYLEKKCGPLKTRELVTENPMKIIQNE